MVSQAVISHTFKWPSAMLLGKQLILALVLALFAGEMSCISQALVVCGCSQCAALHSPLQEEPCSAAAAHCTTLLCFCWEGVCSFPPLLPQRQEMSQSLCSVLTL